MIYIVEEKVHNGRQWLWEPVTGHVRPADAKIAAGYVEKEFAMQALDVLRASWPTLIFKVTGYKPGTKKRRKK